MCNEAGKWPAGSHEDIDSTFPIRKVPHARGLGSIGTYEEVPGPTGQVPGGQQSIGMSLEGGGRCI